MAHIDIRVAPVVSDKGNRFVWRIERRLGEAKKPTAGTVTTAVEARRAYKAEIRQALDHKYTVAARFVDATGAGEEVAYDKDGTMTRKAISPRDGLLGPQCFVAPMSLAARKARAAASRPAKPAAAASKPKPAAAGKPKPKPQPAATPRAPTGGKKPDGRRVRMQFLQALVGKGVARKAASAAWNKLPAGARATLKAALDAHQARKATTAAKVPAAAQRAKTPSQPKMPESVAAFVAAAEGKVTSAREYITAIGQKKCEGLRQAMESKAVPADVRELFQKALVRAASAPPAPAAPARKPTTAAPVRKPTTAAPVRKPSTASTRYADPGAFTAPARVPTAPARVPTARPAAAAAPALTMADLIRMAGQKMME